MASTALERQLKELARKLRPIIEEAMLDEVSEQVIEVAKEKVQVHVYDKYEPFVYRRTGELKGNWAATTVKNGVSIVNMRYDEKKKGRYVPAIVESGIGYRYKSKNGDRAYEKPRPFIQPTRDEVIEKHIHIKALKKGLSDRGVKTKIVTK